MRRTSSPQPQNPTKIELEADAEEKDDEDDEEGDDGEEEAIETGPDPRGGRAPLRARSPSCTRRSLTSLDEARRRRSRRRSEAAQEARRRVHGAQALAAHVRCADRPAARARRTRSGSIEKEIMIIARARCRHAAQGLHRDLPEERDQPALARQARARPASKYSAPLGAAARTRSSAGRRS